MAIHAQREPASADAELEPSSDLAARIRSRQGAGAPLDPATAERLGERLGASFSGVRVHEDAAADTLTRDLDAAAFTAGSDIFFRAGNFRPRSPEGLHLLAHEAAHVVQQSAGPVAGTSVAPGLQVSTPGDAFEQSAERAARAAVDPSRAPVRAGASAGGRAADAVQVQRFGSQEHQSLGNAATGGATVNVGGTDKDARFELYHGDVVALSGDYFEAHELMKLAALPGDKGLRPGTRDEICWALHIINDHDPRFRTGGAWADFTFSDEVKNAVQERYQRLAASNSSHFAAPMGRDAAGAPNPSPASAGGSYRALHEEAIGMAYESGRRHGDLSHAMAMEAAAQHFLTDAFSAGHLRTPAAQMRDHWRSLYPLFWYNLLHKIALDTAINLNARDTNATTMIGTVQMMYETIIAQVMDMAGKLPEISLGDLLAKVFHDYDNESGLDVGGGARVYGDDHLDDPDPRNQTRQLAQAAIQAGNRDVAEAFSIGSAGTQLERPAVCEAVRQATGAAGGVYAAEARMPRPDAAAPAQNWRAGSFEELWGMHITGTTGPTVGERVTAAVQPGGEIHSQLADLATKFPEVDERASGNVHPRAAYRDGFLHPLVANPKSGILSIINWAPNYGLRSVDRDDVSLATGNELRDQKKLSGMTTPARASYVRELIGGSVADDEESLVVSIFETAPAAERARVYQLVEGHEWGGDWRHGILTRDDDIWDALNKQRLTRLKTLINESGAPPAPAGSSATTPPKGAP